MDTKISNSACHDTDGGFASALGKLAEHARPLAIAAIAIATRQSPNAVHAFLDSDKGHHFGCAVWNRLLEGARLTDAIACTIKEWQRYRITARMRQARGLPKARDYLTSFVMYYGQRATA
ncbi:hypothetical protein BYI23_B010950 [Burkholderia sp. YI23]|nr:hypothetical protein BYI23_B010950 [Burkholderia sp. YI23]